MAKWQDAVITNTGLSMLSEVISGKKLEICDVKLGGGTVAAVNLVSQTTVTELLDVKADIAQGTFTEGNGLKIKIRILNTGLLAAVTMKQVGIYARICDETDGEISEKKLFAIHQDSIGEEIPTEEDFPDFMVEFVSAVAISNADSGQISVKISNESIVTRNDLDEVLANYAGSDDFDKLADSVQKLENSKADKSDIPEKLPADGGNADTVKEYPISLSGEKGIPVINADNGTLEIGQRIDFHSANGQDYAIRLFVSPADWDSGEEQPQLKIITPDGTITNINDGGNADKAKRVTCEGIIGTSDSCTYKTLLDWANHYTDQGCAAWAFIISEYGFPDDMPKQFEASVKIESDETGDRRIVTCTEYGTINSSYTRTIYNKSWYNEWQRTNDGGNATTLGNLSASQFMQYIGQQSDATILNDTTYRINYIADIADGTLIGLPVNGWYHIVHLIHQNANGHNCQLAFPLNFDGAAYWRNAIGKTWQAWKSFSDGGNSATVNGYTVNSNVPANAKFTDTTYSVATTGSSGLMSANDKSKLDGIANQANKYTHPSYTARTGVPTANQTPAFGGTFTVTQPVSDASGHITAMTSRTVTIPSTAATTGTAGLVSTSAQTFAGNKTFNGQILPNGATAYGTPQARKLASGTAAATTSNCPSGAWYGQHS